MAVVYQHIREDREEVFYVGIGKTPKRAYSTSARNKHWKGVVQKTSYRVEILESDVSWEDACAIEKQLIKDLGRSDLGLGTLTNKTDGGDGICNPSEETRHKISETSSKRRYSDEVNKKKGKPGESNFMYGKKGSLHPKFGKKYTFTQEHKNKLSKPRGSYSEERKQAMRVPKGPQVTKVCSHCGKSGGNAMLRWHFDNCKFKKR